MNATEVLLILDKLKAIGAHHFKSPDLEVSISEPMQVHMGTTNVVPETVHTTNVVPPPAYDADNTRKVQELIDLLKMKDEQLVNTIFPAGA